MALWLLWTGLYGYCKVKCKKSLGKQMAILTNHSPHIYKLGADVWEGGHTFGVCLCTVHMKALSL